MLNDSYKSDPIFPGDNAYESDSFVYEVGGIEFDKLQRYHHQVTDIDNTFNFIQITADPAAYTANQTEAGGNHLKIANLEGSHQKLDGIAQWQSESESNKVYIQTNQQELAGAGEGTAIDNLPLDNATDHNLLNGPSTRG